MNIDKFFNPKRGKELSNQEITWTSILQTGV